jgi:hypothetical protein
MQGMRGTPLTAGIKGNGLRDLKMLALRWLDSKKRTNHPLIHGTPMCDEVHEIFELLVPAPATAQTT